IALQDRPISVGLRAVEFPVPQLARADLQQSQHELPLILGFRAARRDQFFADLERLFIAPPRTGGVAQVSPAHGPLNIADLAVRLGQVSLQRTVTARFLGQTVEVIQRAPHYQSAGWRGAGEILNRVMDLEEVGAGELARLLEALLRQSLV